MIIEFIERIIMKLYIDITQLQINNVLVDVARCRGANGRSRIAHSYGLISYHSIKIVIYSWINIFKISNNNKSHLLSPSAMTHRIIMIRCGQPPVSPIRWPLESWSHASRLDRIPLTLWMGKINTTKSLNLHTYDNFQ